MKCQRCGKETNLHIMSMFNTQEICMECKVIEENDPRYKVAKEAEYVAVKSGNYNYRGIGW